MKTRFRTVVGLAAGLLVGVTATVQAQFDYYIHDGTVIITKSTGLGGDVVIPDTIEGKPVVSVGEWAFEGCTSLKSITIPDSVTSIGWGAFGSCSSVTTVTIGSGVTNVGDGAFSHCSRLEAVEVDPRNPAYSSLDGVLFSKSAHTLLKCPEWETTRATSMVCRLIGPVVISAPT